MSKGKDIQGRLTGALRSRSIVQSKIDNLKNQGDDTSTLEKILKAYDKDIEAYRETLGIK